MHGGNAKNDTIDAHKIAVLLRGGMRPQAYVYPAERRATRDLLRRRMPLARPRGARLAHVHHTNRQYHLPAIGTKIAYQANRDGVAERFAEPAVQKYGSGSLSSATTMLGCATSNAASSKPNAMTPTRCICGLVPGIGAILSLVLLYAMHGSALPTGAGFAPTVVSASGPESAGQRSGTSGNTIGNAHLSGRAQKLPCYACGIIPPHSTTARLEHNTARAKL
jgi:hypothetical protein